MHAFNQDDNEAKTEIETRQKKLQEKIDAAIAALISNDVGRAITLLHEAKHLSYYVGDGLRVKIQNEDSDLDMHRTLTMTINALEAPT